MKRAVLVLIEDEKTLLALYKSNLFDDMRQRGNIEYLTEAATEAELKHIVKLATRAGQVTLMTRSFGRGTDFLVDDEQVIQGGGLCAIQTFLSESSSEELQIKGRAARHGQNGSYVMVLNEKTLETIGFDKDQIKKYRDERTLYENIQQNVQVEFDKR